MEKRTTTTKAGDTMGLIGAPLQRVPVLHACGHYEARLTRWHGFDPSVSVEEPLAEGFIRADSDCSTCSPQGRPVSQQFTSLTDVQAHCAKENEK